jgi:type I restriction enzyme S subunit
MSTAAPSAASPWPKLKLKYAASLVGARADSRPEGSPYVGLENIQSKTGKLLGAQGLEADEFADGTSTVNLFEAGDVLFGKLRPYLAKAWVSTFAGACTTEALVLRPNACIRSDYLCRVILSPDFIREVDTTTFGSKMPRADWADIGNIEISVPPLAVQREIEQSLHAQASQIEALIASKQRLLDLLTEKRRALIASAVTKGLNPAAPMRDSGIEWLGLVPMHWRSERARWLFGESRLDIRTQDQMVTCFRDGMVTLRSKRREDGFTNGEIEHGYQGIRQGQLVLHSMDAFAGAIGVSDSDGKCTPEYVICDPLTGETDAHYFALLLREMALRRYIQAHCSAVRERAPRIRFNEFKDFVLPLPPLDEQHAIVAYIERQALPLLRLAEHTRTTLDLLKERRTALIAAAVSGDAATPNNQMEEDISHAS